jgi:single-stranded-DNA-specific exonuclease
MIKNWIFKHPVDTLEVKKLARDLNIHFSIASILIQRGVTNIELARQFFRPSLEKMHNPFLMKGMQKTVQRILHAIEIEENILVYGDYDVDGATSVAMFYSFIKTLNAKAQYYIPDRHTEGYGISKIAIERAIKNDISLIISLDCGTKDLDSIALAESYGIDTIVCDHHEPGLILPNAYSILNPKQPDCDYPFKELSGCGIGFKLMQALEMQFSMSFEKTLSYIDLVAVSVACDIVPIINENRIIVYHGLKKIKENPSPGLKSLLETSGICNSISVTDLVFSIGPRINAAGRIDHAHIAVDLLLSENETEAKPKALKLETLNITRREIDNEITNQALDILSRNPKFQKSKTTVLYNPSWHKGVIGIVASRCIEYYYKPTIILTASQGKATGSARSVLGFNLYNAIVQCADLLERYGGHAYAAGLTLPIENIPLFQDRFEAIVSSTISSDCLIQPQIVNADLSLVDADDNFYKILKQMAPFGPGNMQAVFIDRGVVAYSYSIIKDTHLKISIKQKKGSIIDGIGFYLAHCEPIVANNNTFDIAYSLEENTFAGNKKLVLKIRDIKPCLSDKKNFCSIN